MRKGAATTNPQRGGERQAPALNYGAALLMICFRTIAGRDDEP